jgi:hypothetical protein
MVGALPRTVTARAVTAWRRASERQSDLSQKELAPLMTMTGGAPCECAPRQNQQRSDATLGSRTELLEPHSHKRHTTKCFRWRDNARTTHVRFEEVPGETGMYEPRLSAR